MLRCLTSFVLLATLATALLTGCATEVHAPRGVQLGTIPFPSKEPAWVTAKAVPGYPPYASSPDVGFMFETLQLHAGFGALQYALYRLNPGTPLPTVQDVTVTLAEPGEGLPAHQAWIGIADYGSTSWEFSGPYAATQTLPLTATNVSPQGNVWVAVVTYDDATGYVDEVSVGMDVAGELPHADILANQLRADVQNGIFVLSASGSQAAPGHTLVDYAWDLDGDGVFGEAGAEAGYDGSANAELHGTAVGIPGLYLVQVQVTDDSAQQATASATVTFFGSLVLPVDESADDGEHVSLAVIDGKPAMGYYESGSGDLRYTYSSTADGSHATDWTSIAVDATNDVGKFCSLALVNGKPAISYFDETTDDLKYAYSSTADGHNLGDWTVVTVETQDDAGGAGTSLAVISGKPAIAFGVRDPGTQQPTLSYAYSSTADGSSGWTTVSVDSSENAGGGPSLAEVNGKPAISYTRNGSVSLFTQLRYALSSQADGSSGWSVVLVVDPAIVGIGRGSSLAVVGGKPAISYLNQSGNADVEYAYSDTVDGATATDWHTLVLNSGSSAPSDTSLAIINGKPAVAFTSFSSSLTLTYLYSTTPLGQSPSEWQKMDVDKSSNQNFQGYCSLAEVAGGPGIGYYRLTGKDLYYARPAPDL